MGRLRMQEGLIHLPPLQHQDFHNLPAGFEYSNKVSEAFNRSGFVGGVNARDLQHCIVCGVSGYRNVNPVHVIKLGDSFLVRLSESSVVTQTNQYFNSVKWDDLKGKGFVPSFARRMDLEPRNGITLCRSHHLDFNGYRFFIRWVPSVSLSFF
jgi:hypothetical protein